MGGAAQHRTGRGKGHGKWGKRQGRRSSYQNQTNQRVASEYFPLTFSQKELKQKRP